MQKSIVSIVRGRGTIDGNQIEELVFKALELLGDLDRLISPGYLVLVKPNVTVGFSGGETTDPRVTKAVADYVRVKGGRPIIGESSAGGVDTEEAFKATGYLDLRKQGYEVIDLKKTITKNICIPNGKVLQKLLVFELALESDVIISVPVMKTTDIDPASLSLKNMKGVLPDKEKKKFHTTYGVHQAVADLNSAIRPHLTVIDGIIAGEGLFSPYRTQKQMNLIIASQDPVAADTITTEVMGLDPANMLHVRYAEKHGIGTMDKKRIKVVGERVADVKNKFTTTEEAAAQFMNLRDFKIIFGKMACTACRGLIYYCLKRIEEEKKLEAVRNVFFVEGKDVKLPECEKDKIILVGTCTSEQRRKGRYVHGCPPLSSDVMKVVFGGTFGDAWV
jgi:uncharacterized protein (DUF362 family)